MVLEAQTRSPTSGGTGAGTVSAWSRRTGSAGCPATPTRATTRDGFMLRDEIVGYLEEYAAVVRAAGGRATRPRPGCAAGRGGGFEVRTGRGTLTADQVVVATGPYQVPLDPADRRAAARRRPAAPLRRLPQPGRPAAPARCSWSAPGSPAARSPRTCTWPGARCTWPPAARPGWPASTAAGTCVAWLDDMGYYARGIDEFDDADAVRFRANHYVTGRDGGRDIDLRAFARDGMRLYGRLAVHRAGRACSSAATCASNLDHADAVAESIKDSIDAHIDAQRIAAPRRDPLRARLGTRRRARRRSTCGPRASPPSSGPPGSAATTAGSRSPSSTAAATRPTGAASPAAPACTSSACPGSTPGVRAGFAGWPTTRSTSPTASPRPTRPGPAAAPHPATGHQPRCTGSPAPGQHLAARRGVGRPEDGGLTMAARWTSDAHRHLGVLPAYPFYGGPPVSPDTTRPGHHRRADRRPGRRGHRAGAGHPQLRRARPGRRVRVQRAGARGRRSRRPDPRRPVGLAAAAGRGAHRQGPGPGRRARRPGAQAQLPARRRRRTTRPASRSWTRSSPRPGSTAWSCTCTPRPARPPTSTRSASSSTGTPTTWPSTWCTSAAG